MSLHPPPSHPTPPPKKGNKNIKSIISQDIKWTEHIEHIHTQFWNEDWLPVGRRRPPANSMKQSFWLVLNHCCGLCLIALQMAADGIRKEIVNTQLSLSFVTFKQKQPPRPVVINHSNTAKKSMSGIKHSDWAGSSRSFLSKRLFPSFCFRHLFFFSLKSVILQKRSIENKYKYFPECSFHMTPAPCLQQHCVESSAVLPVVLLVSPRVFFSTSAFHDGNNGVK